MIPAKNFLKRRELFSYILSGIANIYKAVIMKIRDILSDLLRNKIEVDSSEENNLYVTWKHPSAIREKDLFNGDEKLSVSKN